MGGNFIDQAIVIDDTGLLLSCTPDDQSIFNENHNLNRDHL